MHGAWQFRLILKSDSHFKMFNEILRFNLWPNTGESILDYVCVWIVYVSYNHWRKLWIVGNKPSNTIDDYWVFGLCPLSGILRTQKKKTFQKLGLFPSSDEGQETPTMFGGPLERASPWLRLPVSDGPNRVGVSQSSPKDGNRSNFWNVVLCL
jgi:hypothetical protein